MELIQNKTLLTVINVEVSSYQYVHIIQQVTVAGTIIAKSTITSNWSEYAIPTDGYYIVTSMRITNTPGTGYYITDNHIYNSNGVEVTPATLMAIVDIGATNIIKETSDHLTGYTVRTYYQNLIQTKFLKGLCACGCMDPQEKITVDSLTMGIALLDVLIENQQYYECQAILEKLTMCVGILNTSCSCHG